MTAPDEPWGGHDTSNDKREQDIPWMSFDKDLLDAEGDEIDVVSSPRNIDIEVPDDCPWLMAPVCFPEGLSATEHAFHFVRAFAVMVALGISSDGGSWTNLLDSILMADSMRSLVNDVIHLWALCAESTFLEDFTKDEQLRWLTSSCLVLKGLDEKVLMPGEVLKQIFLDLVHLTSVVKEEAWSETVMPRAALQEQVRLVKKIVHKVVFRDDKDQNPFKEKAHDMVFRRAGIRHVCKKCWQVVWEEPEEDTPWDSGVNVHHGVAVNIALVAVAAIPDPITTVGGVAVYAHRVLPNSLEGNSGRIAGSVIGVAGTAKTIAVGSVAVLHHHVLAGTIIVAGGPVLAIAAGAGLGFGAMMIGKRLLGPNAEQEAWSEAENVWEVWRIRSPLYKSSHLQGNFHRLLGWNNMRVAEDTDVIEALVERDAVPKGSIKFELVTADHISWTKEIIVVRRAVVVSDEVQDTVSAQEDLFFKRIGSLEEKSVKDETNEDSLEDEENDDESNGGEEESTMDDKKRKKNKNKPKKRKTKEETGEERGEGNMPRVGSTGTLYPGQGKSISEETVPADELEMQKCWQRINPETEDEVMTCKDDVHRAISRTFSVDEFSDGVIGIEVRKAKWLGVVTTCETRPIVAADIDGCTLHFKWLKVSPVDI
eukprot:gnl/MRDRNA2_/MRDRNA2_27116_c0_seq1.p1 gnl/MRDRNA2_/MRDRNA2_27116_c0~~gnl/MRDRNA2_/MRDRNA2_27116_c0_seq1.p1  ORF type:complete len:651 (-),score=144.47 gnl/MRDRNA2_/MRDRNA2_27116_c0_seq1:5-1957(-)